MKLILAGSAVNALCSAVTSSFVYFAASAEGIRSVTFWMLGSLASSEGDDVPLTAAVVILAVMLGVDSVNRRRLYLLVCAVVTGTLVSQVGVIGFVGLLVPHIARSVNVSPWRGRWSRTPAS